MARGRVAKLFIEDLGVNNPVFAQILGICSTLAVTNSVENTVVMCVGLIFTTAFSNLTISVVRKIMPNRVRMMVEVLVIASYVIVFDLAVKAFLPDVSRQLGPYVGLIITNCIIMGRAEAYALTNPPFMSLMDGIASGVGYSYVLLTIAVFREAMGSGTIWGIRVMPSWWTNWSIMVMAPGAFFMLALFVWVVKGHLLPQPEAEGAK